MPVLPSSPIAKEKDDSHENNRRKIVFALLFLLFTFTCTLCSSQLALFTIDRKIIEGSMLSSATADYSGGVPIALAPLDERIIQEAAWDEDHLLSKQTPIAQGFSIAVLPESIALATPVPTLERPPLSDNPTPVPVLPNFTPTAVASAPTATSVASTATPVRIPPTLLPPTQTSLPPTPTSLPPTPTAGPATATLAPPTSTPAPPTSTPAPPTATSVPPTSTSVPNPPTPTSVSPTSTSVPVTSTPTNQPPVANNDFPLAIDEDTAAVINVLSNDSDPDGVLVPGTGVVVSGPANGTATVDPASGLITYVPAPNFNGLDSFSYRVCDDDGACSAALVTLVVNPVNDWPVAVEDTYSTPEDTGLTVPLPGVLANDTDVDTGDILTTVVVSGPVNGLLALALDGSFSYSPNLNFYGIDTFRYQACDGAGACMTALVTITVMPVNDPPVAVPDLASTAEDTLEVIAVLANDSDVDGPEPLSVVAVGIPSHGTISTNGDNITYYPELNFNGTDVFTYTISDSLLAATTVVTVSVEPVNDPPVAVNDVYTLAELPVVAPGVLGNDSDVDGNPLIAVLETGPITGTLVLSNDGSFDYTPTGPGSFSGDSFTYRASDGATSSNIVTVVINSP